MQSRCDGCIEFDKFEDHANLETRAVEPLDDIYFGDNMWDTKMSRSDFWAFAGTYAIKYTSTSSASTLPELPYLFGRQDCASSPDVDVGTTTHKVFPSAVAGWDSTFTWFHDSFGFEPRDVVAILGAHTIGRAHAADSGFVTCLQLTLSTLFLVLSHLSHLFICLVFFSAQIHLTVGRILGHL